MKVKQANQEGHNKKQVSQNYMPNPNKVINEEEDEDEKSNDDFWLSMNEKYK